MGPSDNAVRFTVPKKDAEFWTTPILRLVPYSRFVVQYSSATAHAPHVLGPGRARYSREHIGNRLSDLGEWSNSNAKAAGYSLRDEVDGDGR